MSHQAQVLSIRLETNVSTQGEHFLETTHYHWICQVRQVSSIIFFFIMIITYVWMTGLLKQSLPVSMCGSWPQTLLIVKMHANYRQNNTVPVMQN